MLLRMGWEFEKGKGCDGFEDTRDCSVSSLVYHTFYAFEFILMPAALHIFTAKQPLPAEYDVINWCSYHHYSQDAELQRAHWATNGSVVSPRMAQMGLQMVTAVIGTCAFHIQVTVCMFCPLSFTYLWVSHASIRPYGIYILNILIGLPFRVVCMSLWLLSGSWTLATVKRLLFILIQANKRDKLGHKQLEEKGCQHSFRAFQSGKGNYGEIKSRDHTMHWLISVPDRQNSVIITSIIISMLHRCTWAW